MLSYGVQPDRPIPVEVVRTEGPPGVPSVDGAAMLYVINEPQPSRPDLEIRLGDQRIPFQNIIVTRGLHGVQVQGEDGSGVFKVSAAISDGGVLDWVEVATLSIAGKLPHAVIPGLSFLSEWAKGDTAAVLAIPYGRPVMPLGSLPATAWLREDAESWLRIARHLLRLQSASPEQLPMPSAISSREAQSLDDAARLLDGEILTSEWTTTQFEVRNVDGLGSCLATGPLFQFLTFLPFSVEYDDHEYELDGVVGTWGVAQLADPSTAERIAPGDQVAIVPGGDGVLHRQHGLRVASSDEVDPSELD